MKRLLILLLGLTCSNLGFATPAPPPVVVEMFESQGCSSCPPAEKLLKKLHDEYGAAILPLTYHVDYWDQLGWKDPFSSSRNTQRQNEYSYSFHQDGIYTPEMVVQGEVGFVGSDAGKAKDEISARLNKERPRFELKQAPNTSSDKAGVIFSIPEELAKKTDTITIVLFENAPSVHVLRGENTGATMNGDFAVRRISSESVKKSGAYTVELALEPGQVRSQTGMVVLLQGGVHEILAAESVYPLEKPHAP